MRFDHLMAHQHLSRRDMLKMGAAAAGTAALASSGLKAAAGAQTVSAAGGKPPFDPSWGGAEFSDAMFDLADVPGWAAATSALYGADDQIGAWNEVKPFRTRKAVQELAEKLVTEYPKTYPLGEMVYNGFPAFPSNPPRLHEQHLFVAGNPAGSSGAIQAHTAVPPGGDPDDAVPIVAPLGPNLLTYNEERFDNEDYPGYTFQIATQTDGLNHVGVGTTYYNGVQFEDMVADYGTRKLGGEHFPPIATRGVILDIVGLKQDLGETSDLITAPNGEAMLSETYRITLSDIDVAMRRGRIKEIRPGDVVLFYTGWTHLADQDNGDPVKYLATEPGIYLAETRYLAASRPAIIGGDSWGLEVVGNPVSAPNLFPCHQVLLAQHGIRIGEGYRTHEMIRDNIFEFLFIVTPERSPGSTAGSTSPVGIGVPSNRGPESVRRR